MPRTSAGRPADSTSLDDDPFGGYPVAPRREVVSRSTRGQRSPAATPRGYVSEDEEQLSGDDRYRDEYLDDDPALAGRAAGRGPERDDLPPQDPGDGGPAGPAGRRKRPRYRLRRVLAVLLLLVVAYVASMIWAVTSIWGSIGRVDATPDSTNRPAAASGTNFLLVGTDSRENLSRDEQNDLVTGHTEGARADTIMVLHLPDSGSPTLLSIPRDSYVPIPGYHDNKINAAYAKGGPKLLVDTVEQATGLRIEGYLEIGFGGFVEVVGKVGGVRMCLPKPVVDEKTKLDLKAGCQDLKGKEALNYVRMRYGDSRGDLGRVERQRAFLAALTQQMATPKTMFVPWTLRDVGTTTGAALTIGEDTSMMETIQMALAMRSISSGDGQSITVPVANSNATTWAGSSVLWNEEKSAALFTALNTDAPLTQEP